MGLAEDMNRLRSEIETKRYERQATMSEIRDDVGRIKGDVGTMLHGFRDALEAMATESRSHRQESLQEVITTVGNIREDSVARIAAFREQLQEMSQSSAIERRAFVEAAGDYFIRLKSDVAVMQEAFHAERMANAASDRQARQADITRISGAVEELLMSTHSMRMKFRDELAAARAAWNDVDSFDLDGYIAGREAERSAEAEQARAAKPAASAPAAAKPEPAAKAAPAPSPAPAAAPAPVSSEPDDLTQIVGIGPSTSQVLANAGIVSYRQLAESTVEDVNLLLGELSRFANVAHWTKQAREMLEV